MARPPGNRSKRNGSKSTAIVYDAFISYSHAADHFIAPQVESGLERLAKPWYRFRALNVFRDQSDLALTPHLWSTIATTLDQSRFLVVLLCPESASSAWVNQELTYWCTQRGTDQLQLVVTGGDIAWDRATGDFATTSTAVPSALRGRFAEEPLYEDLRWARQQTNLSLRLSQFRSAVARLAAPMRGVSPDELEGEDIRLHRRARRLARSAIAALAALVVATTIASVLATRSARAARREAARAQARLEALQLLDEPVSKLESTMLRALSAAQRDKANPDRFRVMLALIGRYPRLRQLLDVGIDRDVAVVNGLAVHADGTVAALAVAIGGSGNAEQLLIRPGHRDIAPLAVPVGAAPIALIGPKPNADAVYVVNGTIVVVPAGGVARAVGEARGMWSTGERAVIARDGHQHLIDLVSGTMLTDLGADSNVPALFIGSYVVADAGGQLQLRDSATGAPVASGTLTGDASAIYSTTDGSVAATIETVGERRVLRRWARAGNILTPGADAVDLPTDFVAGALSPSGKRLVVLGNHDHAVIDVATGTVVAHAAGPATARFDTSGRFLAVGGDSLTVIDVESGATVFAVPEPVKTIAWSDGCDRAGPCRVATAGASISLWDARDGTRVTLSADSDAEVVAISPDGSTVASGGWAHAVAVWNATFIADDRPATPVLASGGPTSVDARSGTIARVDGDAIELREPNQPPRRIPGQFDTARVDAVQVVAGGSRLLAGTGATRALLDTHTGQAMALDRGCATADLVASDAGGQWLAGLTTATSELVVCRADDGTRVGHASLGATGVDARVIAVDEIGDVAIGSSQAVTILYNGNGGLGSNGAPAINTGFGGVDAPVTALAFSKGVIAAGIGPPDRRGSDASTPGTARGRVLVWHLTARTEPVAFDVDVRDVVGVSILDDGKVIVSAARDSASDSVVVQVWEAATRRRLGRALAGLGSSVVSLGGDATSIVASDETGRVLRWARDHDPGAEICRILGGPLDDDQRTRLLDRTSLTSGDRALCA